MKKIRILVLALSGLMLLVTEAWSDQISLDIITSDQYPVTGIDMTRQQGLPVHVYNLDDGKRLVKRLAGKLPPNQVVAKQQLENTFKRMGPAAIRQAFSNAFRAQQVAVQYGLDRYPAIVFNQGKAVVYGVTDVGEAIGRAITPGRSHSDETETGLFRRVADHDADGHKRPGRTA